MTYEYLTVEDVLAISNQVVGVRPYVRDGGLLESSIIRPQTVIFGNEAYKTVFDKAAALLDSLARGHCLLDGNKRTSWAAAVVFLKLNGVALRHSFDDTYEHVLAVAQGDVDIETSAGVLERMVASAG